MTDYILKGKNKIFMSLKNHHQYNVIMVLFFLMILSAVQTGCKPYNRKEDIAQLKQVIDSLQHKFAPDKRVRLWVASYSDNSFSLWVEDKTAYDEVQRIAHQRFPDIKANIELLPHGNNKTGVTGLINNSVANLRTKPKHSAEMATQALLGTPVRIFKKQGEWYLIQTPNRYIAWVDSAALVTLNNKQPADYKPLKKVVFNQVSGFSYSKPGTQWQTISDLVMGSVLPVTDSTEDFYKVRYPDDRTAWVLKNNVTDFASFKAQKFNRKKLIKTAKMFLGFPYLWGGTSTKAVDCSGFTSTVYFMNGILLQRDASQQTKYGKVVTTVYKSDNLLPGDLLFFGRPATANKSEKVTHVALYLGEGMFIHASGKVRINSMDSTKPNFIKSYVPRFVRAVRIENETGSKGIELLRNNVFYKEVDE